MKLNKSLGGRIAHQQLTSSQKISIPPFQLEMKKRKQWGEEHTISKPSMRAFFDIYRIVSVRSISHFKPFSFLVLYSTRNLYLTKWEIQTMATFFTKERIPAQKVLKLCCLFPIDFNFLLEAIVGKLKFFAMKALPGGQSFLK